MTTNTAENATAGVPVVRGLEWELGSEPFHDDIWLAESVFGEIYVASHFQSLSSYTWGSDEFSAIGSDDVYPNADEAKAAAQADYEARILSALNPDFLSELDTARAEIDRLGMELAVANRAITAAQARIAELEGAARHILPYLKWTISDESCGHHPTMPSAVAAFEATLSPAVKEPK